MDHLGQKIDGESSIPRYDHQWSTYLLAVFAMIVIANVPGRRLAWIFGELGVVAVCFGVAVWRDTRRRRR